MQSWTNYQFRFKTGSWCIAEYYLPNSDGYIMNNKIMPIKKKDCWLVLMLQYTETEIFKPHYIHV